MEKVLNTLVTISLLTISFLLVGVTSAQAQNEDMKPEETEKWEPVPPVVTPGDQFQPPSDATVLFDSDTGLSKWKGSEGGQASWTVDGDHFTVKAGAGTIETKQDYGSIQLHIEWRTPEEEGEGQDRGNSGIFFQKRYELQVLDSHGNETYSNGMAGSIYKQYIPLANVSRPQDQWQRYDVIFIAPTFKDDGSLKSPARMTVFWNGVLVQYDVELQGPTLYIGKPEYESYNSRGPLLLQDHGHKVSYRNIWVREIDVK